jgi:halocyanin-like protein
MNSQTYSRRGFLRAGAGAAVGGAVLANAGPAYAQTTLRGSTAKLQKVGAADLSFDGYLDDVDNYDGVVDATGQDEVTVEVGSEANGGNFGFGPAAVQVDPGTTAVWEWVAGSHNVEAEDGGFASELTDEEGFTFEQTFDEEGVVKYFCMPHKAMGMKGVVVVGDADVGGGDSGGSQSDGGGAGTSGSGGGSGDLTTADWGAIAFGVSLVAGLLSPLAFAAFIDRDDER